MNGKQLKRIIEDSGRKTADCAIALGITPQSLNSAFHSSDVKSGTIEKVAEWLGVPVFALYGDGNLVNYQTKNNIGGENIVESGGYDACVCRVILCRVGTLLRARRKRVKTHANRLKTKTSPLWLLWRG